MDFKLKFKAGREEPTHWEYVLIGLVFSILVPTLSKIFNSSQEKVFLFLDELQKKLWPGGKINTYIIKSPELLELRVKNTVTRAIEDYKEKEGDVRIIPEPIFKQENPDGSKAQELLGGEMSITSDWKHNKGI